ncbi:MAG: VWA domain-containing protein, partial [Planctomycetota bacterium]
FLIDSSGSMSGQMPARPHQSTTDGLRTQTRFEAATEQLEKFLANAEEGTVFRLGLFSSGGKVYNTAPHRADERGRQAALRWMNGQKPDGGTVLSSGMDKLVKPNKAGAIDLENLGFDTLIILCDGATAEGRSWARAWLRSYNTDAQLVIHAVQIGSGPALALETLAEGSGGQFVRVE